MIHLENVEKVYRTDRIETLALSRINLAVPQGAFVSIIKATSCTGPARGCVGPVHGCQR